MCALARHAQVDDLEEIGDLEGYIDRTSTILIYCSKGYFQSKNCMRELVSTAIKQKPTIALVDPDASRDGLSDQEVRAQLLEDQDGNFAKWGFDAETTPNAQALHDHLFQAEPIEWNRERSHEAPHCRSADCDVLHTALRRHWHLSRRDDAPPRRAAAARRRRHHVRRRRADLADA
jgi:hypothetical protein